MTISHDSQLLGIMPEFLDYSEHSWLVPPAGSQRNCRAPGNRIDAR